MRTRDSVYFWYVLELFQRVRTGYNGKPAVGGIVNPGRGCGCVMVSFDAIAIDTCDELTLLLLCLACAYSVHVFLAGVCLAEVYTVCVPVIRLYLHD